MTMIHECGLISFAILALGGLALAVCLVAVALALWKPRVGLVLSVLAVAASCGVPALGVVGTMYGRSITEGAISGASIDPDVKARIREAGYAEAAQCTTLGAGTGALPILLSFAALSVAFLRRQTRAAQ
jgi:hypothetical protein